ncbi:integral membrane sensor signal transduction histidine kinase [candidate division TM7 genomosp. GTL1]|nr:integral membrane sensor signal transduction histidine kinase [candidate division TM7 genomosp. GTL1]
MTFRDAYLKLTGFYVLIIMVISLLFSVWVYNEATQELRMGLAAIDKFANRLVLPGVDEFVRVKLREGQLRILMNLFILNVIVLGAGAGVSYLLARRTMQPIEEAMEAKDRFTADASHELRTPLAAMRSEIEVTLRDPKRSKADTEELLRSNLEEIDRLNNLAEGLLVLTNEEPTLELQPIQIDEVVRKVCDRFRPLAAAKQITLTCEATKMTAATQQQALEKILGILIDNAIKYSPEKVKSRSVGRETKHELNSYCYRPWLWYQGFRFTSHLRPVLPCRCLPEL